MQNKLLYLSMQDVENADVGMEQIIDALECAYRQKGQGKVEVPPTLGIHTRPNALIHAMPAYIFSTKAAGMKWVSAYPENFKYNVPQVSGLIVLNDDETGVPYCIMDCRWVTAKRTGAKSAVAAGYFARKDAKAVGIIGCGVQGRSNLEALSHRFDIELVCAYDIDAEAASKYASEMDERLDLTVKVVDTPEQAVREMDIVVTASPIKKNPDPVIENSWFKQGAFGAPVDFDSYWKQEVLQNVDLFATDDLAQLLHYQALGYCKGLPAKEQIHDLGDVAIGKAPHRQNDTQRILAMNFGLALDDMATAPFVYQAAKEKGIGTWLDL
jgi:ornithine cyclodeaminase/alanine dehydrogenase-like protein (mu-crystallin family)